MPKLLSEAALTLEQHIIRVEYLSSLEILTNGQVNKLVKSQEVLRQHAKAEVHRQKRKQPLSHCKPSYLQSLKMNSWMNGRTFVLDFESNRQGKTAWSVIRVHLFMCPPSPISPIFKAHDEDNPFTRDEPHQYQVLPPPAIGLLIDIDPNDPILELDPFVSHLHPRNLPIFLQAVRFSPLLEHIRDDIGADGIYRPTSESKIEASFLSTHPENLNLESPLPDRHIVWHCSPDHKKFKDVCAATWKDWTPESWIAVEREHDGYIKIVYPNKISIEINSKSYDSDDKAFMGDAVRIILITEGPPLNKWKEMKLRFQYPALGNFDYTPAESTNTSSSAHLAEQIYKGKEEVPLQPIVFSGYGIEFAPPHILPTKKKEDLIRMYRHLPEGAARLDGKFFSTTPKALHALDKDFHCLPLTFNEFVKQYYPNFDHDPSIKFRGYDEGSESPSACVWGALMPDDVWVIYRAWQKNRLVVDQICKEIIEKSGNIRKERRPSASGQRRPQSIDKWYYEDQVGEKIVMTIADYHIFAEDNTTGKTHARNYVQAGLLLRASITAGPEQRVIMLNNKLAPSEDERTGETVRSRKIVFLMKEPGIAEMIDIFEEWYWEHYLAGPKKDMPKDKVSDVNDHLADALSYIVLSPFKWSPSLARMGYRNQFNSKPDEKYYQQLKEFFEDLAA